MQSKILIVSALLLSGAAMAQTKAPEPDWTVAGNVSLNTDYRFRGFSQTNFRPALQGGIDITHKSGFYVGNWNSNVLAGAYNGASLEMDFYGGYKGTVGPFGYDVGAIYYDYPGSGSTTANTVRISNTELYGGLSWGPVSGKLYYATGDYFKMAKNVGAPQSTKGTTYLDLSYAQDFSGWLVGAHYGLLNVQNNNQALLTTAAAPGNPAVILPKHVSDYKLSLGRDIGNGFIATAALVGTSKKYYFGTGATTQGGGAGKTAIVLSVAKTF